MFFVFDEDQVGISVSSNIGIGVTVPLPCPQSISWTGKLSLSKLGRIYYLDLMKSWLGYGMLDFFFKVSCGGETFFFCENSSSLIYYMY